MQTDVDAARVAWLPTEGRDTPVRRPRRGRPWTGTRPVSLSILMPAYNEADTIEHAVTSVLETRFPCDVELIVVDDGSSDGTWETLSRLSDRRLRVFRHPRNLGKGAAIQTGANLSSGSHLVPFDADLEYDPDDLNRLLEPVLAQRCDVVFGTRMFGMNTVYQSYRFAVGNRMLTQAANLMFDAYVSDLHTCLKLMPRVLLQQMDLREAGFGLDTEITATLLKNGIRPFEVPISYHSRSHDEGKKITWWHGVECLRILGRIRFGRRTERLRTDPVPAYPDETDVLRAVTDELEHELDHELQHELRIGDTRPHPSGS